MTGMQMSEGELVDAAVAQLGRLLPASWAVERQVAGDAEGYDVVVKGPGSNSQALILVEAKSDVSRRDVEGLISGPWRRWRRQMGNQAVLVVAPYIGPSVRKMLAAEDISYIDLSGNARVSVQYPAVFIETQGARQDPHSVKPRAGIRGAKAGAVVRALVDVAPPYTGAEIARAAKVNEGYLSRILDTLTDEGLIDRESFGPVTGVDWPQLLRRRAQAVDLFRPAGTFRYVARNGTTAVLEQLRGRRLEERPAAVTGSFAAARLAPVAAPMVLAVYTMNPNELGEELELLPADAGADTVLLRPDNDVVFARAEREGGIVWAAPSQVALDCLAGNGRMPSEGEALIDWMRQNEGRWRSPSIRALLDDSADPVV